MARRNASCTQKSPAKRGWQRCQRAGRFAGQSSDVMQRRLGTYTVLELVFRGGMVAVKLRIRKMRGVADIISR